MKENFTIKLVDILVSKNMYSFESSQLFSLQKRTVSSWFFVFLFSFSLLFSVVWFSRSVDTATPPSIITYQGKLLEDGASVTTTKAMAFVIYDAASGGTALYTAAGTLPATSTVSVTPTQGIFSVDLGGSGTNALDSTIFQDNDELYLEVVVDGTTLTPRKRLTASPYAVNSTYLNGAQATSTPQSTTYIPMSDIDGSFAFNTTTFFGDLSGVQSFIIGTEDYVGFTAGTTTVGLPQGVVSLFGSSDNGAGMLIYHDNTDDTVFRMGPNEQGDRFFAMTIGGNSMYADVQGSDEVGNYLFRFTATSSADSFIDADFFIGNSGTNGIFNPSFVMDGDDFYVEGDSGFNGNIFSDGVLDVAGTGTSTFGGNASFVNNAIRLRDLSNIYPDNYVGIDIGEITSGGKLGILNLIGTTENSGQGAGLVGYANNLSYPAFGFTMLTALDGGFVDGWLGSEESGLYGKLYFSNGIDDGGTITINGLTGLVETQRVSVLGTATSTFAGSIDLEAGNCFAVNGTCIGGGAGNPGGTDGQLQWNDNGVFNGITGITSDGSTLVLATGTLFKAEDKDGNIADFAGYLGEIFLFGDIVYGNESFITSGDTASGWLTLVGVSADDGFAFESSSSNTSTEEQINQISFDGNRDGALFELKYETIAALPGGTTYDFITRSLQPLSGDVVHNFRYFGNNDGLSDVQFASDVILAGDITLGAESGEIQRDIVINGALTRYQTVNADGVRYDLDVLLDSDTQLLIRNSADTDNIVLASLTNVGVDIIGLAGGIFAAVPDLGVAVITDPTGDAVAFNIDRATSTVNEIIGTQNFTALNSLSQNTTYGRIFSRIVDDVDGAEAGELIFGVMENGSIVNPLTLTNGQVQFSHIPRFDAELVAGSRLAYAEFETSLDSGVYAYQFGGGTTVPSNGTTGWSGSAIFTDVDAAVNEKIWVNVGDSSSAAFRRLLHLDSNGYLGIGTANPTTLLSVLSASSTSNAENLAYFSVNDASGQALRFRNGTSTDNLFVPEIQGNSFVRTALQLVGETNNDWEGWTDPLVSFKALFSGGDGTLTGRENLFAFSNGTQQLINIGRATSTFYTDLIIDNGLIEVGGLGTSTIAGELYVLNNAIKLLDVGGAAVMDVGSVSGGVDGAVVVRGTNPSLSMFLDDTFDNSVFSVDVESNIASIRAGSSGVYGQLNLFDESGVEYLRLSATSSVSSYTRGSLGIGTTTPAYRLHALVGTDGIVAAFTDSDATCTVDPSDGDFSCTSDRNLKTNISVMGSALESVVQLNPVVYNWNTDPNGEVNYGFIAQEVEALFPRLVGTGANGYKTLSQIGLIPFLTKAIQEQQTQIEALSVSQGVSGSLDWSSGDLDLGGFALLNTVSITGANGQWSIDEFGRLVSNVETTNGETKSLYGLQSEDGDYVISGSGQLNNGQVTILFEEGDKSLIDTSAEMRVSITLTGEANGVYVTDKSVDGFVVRELQGGSSSATFDWVVITKRLVEGQVVDDGNGAPQSEGGEPLVVEDTGGEISNESNGEVVEDSVGEVIVETGDEEVTIVPEEVVVPDETPTVIDIVVPEEAPPAQDPPIEEGVSE